VRLAGRLGRLATRGLGLGLTALAAVLRAVVYIVASPAVILADLVQPDPRFERGWVAGFMGFITLAILLTWGAGYSVTAETLEGNALLANYRSIGPDLAKVPYIDIIQRAAAENGIDPALVAAIIAEESGFDAEAVSVAGARGLMQLLPATWRALRPDSPCRGDHAPPACGPDCIFSPEANIRAGTKYFADILAEFDGNAVLAFAAYNAGSATVHRYADSPGASGDGPAGTTAGREPDLPPYAETRAYVKKALALWVRLRTGGTPDVVTLSVQECRLLRQTATVLPLVVLGLWALFAVWVLRRMRLPRGLGGL